MFIILILALLLLIYGPQLWVRYVISKYSKEIEDMPGTGAELAKHLLERFEMHDYVVEQTDANRDHFSPSEKAVRLGPNNYNGKSLSAIAIAAHEVGHAIQFHKQEPVSVLRSRYTPPAKILESAGVWLLRLLPVIALAVKVPSIIIAIAGISLVLQLLGALMLLSILPEEWDASFKKALPILTKGEYIPAHFEPAIRKVLKAAALTYFAGALANILNIARLFLLLRR